MQVNTRAANASQAVEQGQGYPAGCLERISQAKDAVAKIMKAAAGTMNKLKAATKNQLVDQAMDTLEDKMAQLQQKDSVLESMRLFGKFPDKSAASVQQVGNCDTMRTEQCTDHITSSADVMVGVRQRQHTKHCTHHSNCSNHAMGCV